MSQNGQRTERPGLLLVGSLLHEESTRRMKDDIALNGGYALELWAWSSREHPF